MNRDFFIDGFSEMIFYHDPGVANGQINSWLNK